MRMAGAVVAGIAVAVLGALIIGEYQFDGFAPVVIGLLFGLAVAEAMVWVARGARRWFPLAAGLVAAAGLVWAGWITVRHRHQGIPAGAWLAAVLAAGVAAFRTRAGTARSAGSGSRPGP